MNRLKKTVYVIKPTQCPRQVPSRSFFRQIIRVYGKAVPDLKYEFHKLKTNQPTHI